MYTNEETALLFVKEINIQDNFGWVPLWPILVRITDDDRIAALNFVLRFGMFDYLRSVCWIINTTIHRANNNYQIGSRITRH